MIEVSKLKEYGIELVKGDVLIVEEKEFYYCYETKGYAIILDDEHNHNGLLLKEHNEKSNIKEFVWRKPVKVQPVDGDSIVEVVTRHNTIIKFPANEFSWSSLSNYKEWRPSMQWLIEQEAKNKQEDEMISQCNLDKDIASIKESELHKSPVIPFEPLSRTLTKKDYLIQKAADTLTYTQYMHFMSIVDVMIEKGLV